ncbi:MAG: glycoside hydrolase family 32 protein [Cytophagaceae bacterium]|nr:glycoside hydrolase family 32 protein [Cytophagaceae bacterium]
MQKLILTLTALTYFAHHAHSQVVTKPEPYRPRYHFTPPKNWINDPNGLIYHAGEYHLFYQYNPFGNEWGHMSWGHAVAKDLLTWQHLPLAIPEFTHADGKTKTAIFSGSAVMDQGNKSGLCPGGTKECMVAIYTGNVTEGDKQTAQYQNLAYSADNGRTWTQYAKNPVLDLQSKEFRDPNVFWYSPQQKWVMAAVKATEHRAVFFESKNLKDWKLLSYFGPQADTSRVWECPALVSVPVLSESGQPGGENKWVLFISAGHPQKGYLGMQYFVGNFDGTTFTVDKQNPKPVAPAEGNRFAGAVVDWGKDYYAAIPFNDLPNRPRNAGPQKPVMIGWLNDWEYANKLPTTPFKGAMSVPREISLQKTPEGYQLVQTPVSLQARRGKPTTKTNLNVTGTVSLDFSGESYELQTEIALGSAKKIGIQLLKSGDETSTLTYDVATSTLYFDRTRSGNVAFSDRFPSVESMVVKPQNGVLKLHLLVDASIVEIFANGGQQVMTDLVFPTKHEGRIELVAEGGSAVFKTLTIWPIQ